MGVRLLLGVEPVTHLDVVWALPGWVGAGGGDFLMGGLVAADVRVVLAAIERIHRNEAAVVESRDVFVDFGVEAWTLRWRLQRRGSSRCRRVFCCKRAMFSVLGASIGPRMRLVRVGFGHRIRACPGRLRFRCTRRRRYRAVDRTMVRCNRFRSYSVVSPCSQAIRFSSDSPQACQTLICSSDAGRRPFASNSAR